MIFGDIHHFHDLFQGNRFICLKGDTRIFQFPQFFHEATLQHGERDYFFVQVERVVVVDGHDRDGFVRGLICAFG